MKLKSSITTRKATGLKRPKNGWNITRKPVHPGEMLREEFMIPPGLSANRRARLQLALSRSDRIDRQPKSLRERRRQTAVCVNALRCVPRHLPGEDRHPANPAASACEREPRRSTDQVALGCATRSQWCATVCGDGAISAHVQADQSPRRTDAAAILARWLRQVDAGAIQELDALGP